MNKNQITGTILIVDDSLENLQLLSRVLKEQGYKIRAAKTGREAIESAKAELPDLVLLDIKLPDIDGFEVCRILKTNEETSAVPILFISALDETKEKMHGFVVGGVDYITKPFNIQEVLVRVQNHMEIGQLRTQLEQKATELQIKNDELKEQVIEQEQLNEKLYESFSQLENSKTAALNLLQDLRKEVDIRKNNEATIRLSEEKFKNVFERSPIGKSLTAIDGKVNVNSTFCKMLGYSPEELSNVNWRQITHPDDIEITQKYIDPLLKGEAESVRFRKRYMHKNGSVIWTDVNSFLQKDKEGNPLYFITAMNDITHEVFLTEKLRETNEYLENLYNYSNAPIIVWDPSLKITRFNQAFENLSGYNATDVIGKNIEILFPENKIESSLNLINNTTAGSRWESVEIEILRKDGEIKIVLWNSANIYNKDLKQIISTIAQGNDITERKKAEIMLSDEKDRIRTILDLVGDPIFVKDNHHRITLANRAFYNIFNLDENNVIGYTLVESVPENEQHHFLKVDRSVLDTGISDQREEELTVGDLTHTIITRKIRFIDDSGKKFLVGSIHDITERKLAEMQLEESEEKYRLIADNTDDWIYWIKPDGNFQYISPSCEKLTGYSVQEFMDNPKLLEEITYTDDREIMIAHKQKLTIENPSDTLEYRMVTKSGEILWIQHSCSSIYNQQGEYAGRRGTNRNITQRKRSEEALNENNSRLELAMHTANMAWWEMEMPSGNIIFNNRKAEMLGYPPENFKHYADFMSLVHPEDTEKTMDAMRKHMYGNAENYETEYRIMTNSGKYKWFYDIGSIVKKDSNGKPLNITGLVIDISKRKQSEAAQAQLLHILESTINEIYVFNAENLIFEYCNQAALNNLGYSYEEIQRITPLDLKPEFTEESFRQLIKPLLDKHQEHIVFETVHRRANKSHYPVEVHLQLVQLERKRVFLSVILDITQRKQSEEKLKESLDLLRIAGQLAKLGGWSVILEENLCYWSNEVAAIHEMPAGYTPLVDEGINFYAPEWRERIIKVFTDCAQKGISYNEEMEIIVASGKKVWIQTIGEAVRNDKGTIYKVQGAFQDISERKQAEQKILIQLEELQRWYKVTQGREVRTRELKKEVNELLLQMGEPIRYPSQDSN